MEAEQAGLEGSPLSFQSWLAFLPEPLVTREAGREDDIQGASWLASCFAGQSMVLEDNQGVAFQDMSCCFSSTFHASEGHMC